MPVAAAYTAAWNAHDLEAVLAAPGGRKAPAPAPGAPPTRAGFVQAAPGGDWFAADQVLSVGHTATGSTVVGLRGGDAATTYPSTYTVDGWLSVLAVCP